MSASMSSVQSIAASPAPIHGPGGLLGTQVTRLEKTTACLPIVYGSVAFYLGKKAGEYQTHQWTLYLRGPNGDEDLSPVISKVVFQLHASFAQPTRELSEPP
jgi:YEATS domain-containing protein 4